MHHYESECHAKRLICYFQGQGHCKSSYDQNMTISTVSFETADPFATKLGLIVHYHKPECHVKKKPSISAFKVKMRVKDQMSVFVQMISSKLLNTLLPNLVL